MANSPIRKIGVDLDNTLIDYDSAFLYGAKESGLVPSDWQGDKKRIKDYLRLREGGEHQWQNLQGQVYGRLIAHARLFDGVYRFLWRCRQRGIEVELVSHKTEFGHNDANKVPLRQVALEFLASHGIVPGGKDSLLREVFFESTRERKIQRIIENGYDWFIDDLIEILEDSSLPENMGRILFDGSVPECGIAGIENCGAWPEIERRLLGEWTEPELQALAGKLASETIASVRNSALGGNSGLLEVIAGDGKKYVLKLYPPRIGHDRLSSEYDGFRALKAHDIDAVPAVIQCDARLNAAMYEWIEGGRVTRPNSGHVRQALDFLEKLHQVSKGSGFEKFPNASAAFFSGTDFERQLKNRFYSLMQVAGGYPELYGYLQGEVLPAMERITNRAQSAWTAGAGYSGRLPRSMQTLSPSDFGFHNTVEREDGRLVFVDFEYFGWDDPVKLIVDFVLHPGMVLDSSLKQQWIDGAIGIYGDEMLERLKLAWPMIGICWCLILLNEYRDDVWRRRCAANAEKFRLRETILATQLERSRDLLETIGKYYEQPIPIFN